jgi:hypothetical protein
MQDVILSACLTGSEGSNSYKTDASPATAGSAWQGYNFV